MFLGKGHTCVMFADVCAEKAIVNGETEASTNLRYGAGVIREKKASAVDERKREKALQRGLGTE